MSANNEVDEGFETFLSILHASSPSSAGVAKHEDAALESTANADARGPGPKLSSKREPQAAAAAKGSAGAPERDVACDEDSDSSPALAFLEHPTGSEAGGSPISVAAILPGSGVDGLPYLRPLLPGIEAFNREVTTPPKAVATKVAMTQRQVENTASPLNDVGTAGSGGSVAAPVPIVPTAEAEEDEKQARERWCSAVYTNTTQAEECRWKRCVYTHTFRAEESAQKRRGLSACHDTAGPEAPQAVECRWKRSVYAHVVRAEESAQRRRGAGGRANKGRGVERIPGAGGVERTLGAGALLPRLEGVLLAILVLRPDAGTLCGLVGFVYPACKSFQALERQDPDAVKSWLTYWVAYSFLAMLGFDALLAAFAPTRGVQVGRGVASFVYPVLKSFPAFAREPRGTGDAVQWLTYWVVRSCFTVAEACDDILPHLPVYNAGKSAFLLWACLPQTRGAEVLHRNFKKFLGDGPSKNPLKLPGLTPEAALDNTKLAVEKVVTYVRHLKDTAVGTWSSLSKTRGARSLDGTSSTNPLKTAGSKLEVASNHVKSVSEKVVAYMLDLKGAMSDALASLSEGRGAKSLDDAPSKVAMDNAKLVVEKVAALVLDLKDIIFGAPADDRDCCIGAPVSAEHLADGDAETTQSPEVANLVVPRDGGGDIKIEGGGEERAHVTAVPPDELAKVKAEQAKQERLAVEAANNAKISRERDLARQRIERKRAAEAQLKKEEEAQLLKEARVEQAEQERLAAKAAEQAEVEMLERQSIERERAADAQRQKEEETQLLKERAKQVEQEMLAAKAAAEQAKVEMLEWQQMEHARALAAERERGVEVGVLKEKVRTLTGAKTARLERQRSERALQGHLQQEEEPRERRSSAVELGTTSKMPKVRTRRTFNVVRCTRK